jgi:capsular polysaccharide transport system permease protein
MIQANKQKIGLHVAGAANTKDVQQAPATPQVTTAPKVKVVTVSASAAPATMHSRHWMLILSFVLFVILPTLGAGYYFYTYAADQYASKIGFTVRNEDTGSAFEFLGGLTNISGSSSSDTDILYEFIQSQQLVRAIDQELDLKTLYQKPQNDPVFRLKDGATIEDLVNYWTRMVRIVYDPGTGLIEVEVRAFDPNDARTIARNIFERSSTMINGLSAIARNDVTRYAKDELDQAVARLKTARQNLTRFRNETQIVDPGADIKGQMGLLNSLQAQLAETLIEQDLLIDIARDNDPRMELARRKIVVIRNRIEIERRKMGVSGEDNTGVFADLVGQFESLQVDLEFAEKAYVSALSAYDSAVSEARRKSRYLAAYVQPTMAESSLYPKRGILLSVVALILFGVWTILVLVYYSLRDRR